MERKPVVAFAGKIKGGKSTLINSLISQVVSPSATLECTSLITEIRLPAEVRESPARKGKTFGILTEDGEDGHLLQYPFDQIKDYIAEPDSEVSQRLILYASDDKKQQLLDALEIIDLPGRDSASHAHANVIAENFLKEMDQYDILVRVIANDTDLDLQAANRLPPPQILVLNKLDKLIRWDGLNHPDPESVFNQAVNQAVNAVQEQMAEEEFEPPTRIVGVSAILGLAAAVFDDTIFSQLIDIAQGDYDYNLDAPSSAERLVIQKANRLMRSEGESENNNPAYPALKFILDFSKVQGKMSARALRAKIHHLSGIPQLRDALIELSHNPSFFKIRADLCHKMMEDQRERAAILNELNEIIRLRSGVQRLINRPEHRRNGDQEQAAFFEESSSYLSSREAQLRAREREMRSQYRHHQQSIQESLQKYLCRQYRDKKTFWRRVVGWFRNRISA